MEFFDQKLIFFFLVYCGSTQIINKHGFLYHILPICPFYRKYVYVLPTMKSAELNFCNNSSIYCFINLWHQIGNYYDLVEWNSSNQRF